ncbi:LOW QUALITY PROTEIN: granzyme-like protein 2 [Arvicola amphibius]|uniref:LOW QUALITY PROTEIN: granzyme-like protein 2 n=1 Tax=Arvicola amphibius TaxID=1047088 RepID=UPI001C0A28BD|nr:LOW QUALITY PROTEIN: granzyme-like protein 2 [Arvicola amphibius]
MWKASAGSSSLLRVQHSCGECGRAHQQRTDKVLPARSPHAWELVSPLRKTFLLLFLLVAVLPFSSEGRKIFWGTEAKCHSHPYMAFLEIYESRSHRKQCGGFLVEKDIVMTAAHCNGSEINVVLGAHNIKQWNNTQRIPVVKAICHKGYNRDTKVNDIMLLKLKHKAQLSNAVKTIDLPKSQDWVKPGQVCMMAGWGQLVNCSLPNTLQEVKLEVQNSQMCQVMSRDYNNSIHLSVGNPKEKKATGKGLLLFMFVCDNVAQGIVSYKFCTKKPPRVFTRISSFIPWIRETMKLLQQS